jgi:hypothetical protein
VLAGDRRRRGLLPPTVSGADACTPPFAPRREPSPDLHIRVHPGSRGYDGARQVQAPAPGPRARLWRRDHLRSGAETCFRSGTVPRYVTEKRIGGWQSALLLLSSGAGVGGSRSFASLRLSMWASGDGASDPIEHRATSDLAYVALVRRSPSGEDLMLQLLEHPLDGDHSAGEIGSSSRAFSPRGLPSAGRTVSARTVAHRMMRTTVPSSVNDQMMSSIISGRLLTRWGAN